MMLAQLLLIPPLISTLQTRRCLPTVEAVSKRFVSANRQFSKTLTLLSFEHFVFATLTETILF